MPDDRFADLGPGDPGVPPGRTGASDRRSAGERLAELDEQDPDRPQSRPEPPPPARPGSRYGWVVGVAFTLIVIVAVVNLVRDSDNGDLIRGLAPGERLPDFAAPLATGSLEGDANVRPLGEASDAAGRRPACDVRSPEVVNVCELRRRPSVLTFIVTQGADCAPQVDVLDRVRRDFPAVNFAAVVSRSSREDAAALARRRSWNLPVAVDRDGAVINLYRLGVCPATVFAEAGGRVRTTVLGPLNEQQLRAQVRALVRPGR